MCFYSSCFCVLVPRAPSCTRAPLFVPQALSTYLPLRHHSLVKEAIQNRPLLCPIISRKGPCSADVPCPADMLPCFPLGRILSHGHSLVNEKTQNRPPVYNYLIKIRTFGGRALSRRHTSVFPSRAYDVPRPSSCEGGNAEPSSCV